ncbi:nuclear transport factor 2 family protein [Pseudonocardia sp. GCM10023141]|uniref:nuclear transport factor 2 family protein n=1 Tax=Pseudonocardia sp. GCM10023141 TaxID=3252653 RepID=UPI0036148C80
MTPPTGLSAADRAVIDDLLASYAFAIDLQAWDELREVFATGAEIDYSGGTQRHAGIEAIVAFFRDTAGRVAATQHLLHTSRVWSTGPDTAAGLTHVTAHHVARGSAQPAPEQATFTVTGTYTDRFIRTPAGWRIAARRLDLLTSAGDPAMLHPTQPNDD